MPEIVVVEVFLNRQKIILLQNIVNNCVCGVSVCAIPLIPVFLFQLV